MTGDSGDELTDDAVLWRRVRPDEVVFDENLQRMRPKSQAFQNYPKREEMSVILASEIGFSTEIALGDAKDYLLVWFPVSLVRECGQDLIPAREEGPGHFHVKGKKSGTVKDKFAKRCDWVIPPKTNPSPSSR